MEEERGVADQKETKNEVVLRISDTEKATFAKKEQRTEGSSFSPKGSRDSHDELTRTFQAIQESCKIRKLKPVVLSQLKRIAVNL